MGCKEIRDALVVNLGDDEFWDSDYEDLQRGIPSGVAIIKIIYWYKKGDYKGGGTIVYQDSRHEWHIDDLTHCSCFGPCHNGFSKITYSLDEIKRLLEKEDYYENGGKEILSYLSDQSTSIKKEASDE